MRRIWLTLGALALFLLGTAVVSVVVITATWPTLSEEEQFQPIHAVAFFPDGCRFATMNNAGPVRIWDVKTGKELSRFTPGGRNLRDAGIIAMAVSGDGRYLAGASNRDYHEKYGFQVWDVATAQIVGTFAGHSEMVKAIAFTPDGRSVLSAGYDKTIRVWDIATGREIHCLRGHESSVNALAVTPDGRYAISGAGDYNGGESHDPTIRMWELDGGSMVRVFEGHSGLIDDIAISPGGKLMASVSCDASLKIWNLSTGAQLQTWRAPRGIFNAVSFSPNGKNLLTGSAYSAEGAVQLWDIATCQELRDFGMKTIAHDIAFSPDGKTLVSAQEITVPSPPPHPFALIYAEEMQAGIAVVSDVDSGRELSRVGAVPRQPARQQSIESFAKSTAFAARPTDQPEAPIDELLALYRSYGLPLAPDGATLVRFESGWRRYEGKGKKDTPLDYLGFLLKPAMANHPAVALVGTRELTLRSTESKVIPVAPDPALARDSTIKENEGLFGLTSTLALALQCKSRGWGDLARALLENRRWREVIPIPITGGTVLSPRQSVGHMAWKHWENALVDADSDRAKIADRMRALLVAEPSLTEWDRGTMAALEATLKPSQAEPGSIEAMIDGLVNISAMFGDSSPPDPLLLKLEQLGFEAIPALIDHWDDTRLTRRATNIVGNSKGYLVSVCGPIRNLVIALAGDGLKSAGGRIEKKDVLAWWAEAQQIGEEKYLVAHILPARAKEKRLDPTMLRIIAAKYPRHLPEIYDTILEKRPEFLSCDVAEALSKSSLPRETKRQFLLVGANHSDLEHRRYALWALKDIDKQEFLRILVTTVESLPNTPPAPFLIWQEAAFANLVMQTEDDRAWRALEKVAKRADVAVRMEFMGSMDSTTNIALPRRPRLEFLSHFLDDDAVRDNDSNPKVMEGAYAALYISKIEVRNFAASQIASILKLGVKPDEYWSPARWAELRARVRDALAHELDPDSARAVR